MKKLLNPVMQFYTAKLIFPDGTRFERHCLNYDSANYDLCDKFKYFDAANMSHYEEFQRSIFEKDYYEGADGKVYSISANYLYELS